ncbi:carboxypeptidase-like regulatory domain-containing protein [Adhaeretor mobilis]|uniref:Carboxypeptidase regulatory-like domain-containing protein n=1 Tax=Adhaeretor mobilis TaxID=1930276 RepID=A0A517N0Y2_9BACT|nr:carboxypeptidase-like regulatory domain-containing protein [Adhaeretor mobilis]QDT00802.1 hypothetical protein HG15A2_41440 [Adhaeretor mobilis]
MTSKRWFREVLTVALVAVTVGCGGVYDSTISGKVSLDNQALSRGAITFQPITSGPPSTGRIKSDGSYRIRTGSEIGLPPGEYKVTIRANEAPANAVSKDGGPPPIGKRITPVWYDRASTTPLSFQVQPGPNTYDIELSEKPPEGWVDPAKKRRR